MRKRVISMAVAIITMCVLTSAPAASAEDRYTRQVRAQLNFVEVAMEEMGFASTHDAQIDKLQGDGTDAFTLTLQKGVEYRIAAVCDHDCGDIDIQLFDENDNNVAEDNETDSTPIVSITPRWTGRFEVHVRMYDCKADPCYYGLGVYGK